jgi:hypothetical protein
LNAVFCWGVWSATGNGRRRGGHGRGPCTSFRTSEDPVRVLAWGCYVLWSLWLGLEPWRLRLLGTRKTPMALKQVPKSQTPLCLQFELWRTDRTFRSFSANHLTSRPLWAASSCKTVCTSRSSLKNLDCHSVQERSVLLQLCEEAWMSLTQGRLLFF